MLKFQLIAKQFLWLFAILTIIVSVGINIVQKNEIAKLKRQRSSTAFDQPFVTEAIRLWSEKTHSSPDTAMNERFSKVMYIDREVCVSLEIDLGGVGGVPVYCFDSDNQKLTKRIDNVE